VRNTNGLRGIQRPLKGELAQQTMNNERLVVERNVRSLGYQSMSATVTLDPFNNGLPDGLVTIRVNTKANEELGTIVMTFDQAVAKTIQYRDQVWQAFEPANKSSYFRGDLNPWPPWIVPVIFNTIGLLNSKGASITFGTSRSKGSAYALYFSVQ
jgi:hypothetical protein